MRTLKNNKTRWMVLNWRENVGPTQMKKNCYQTGKPLFNTFCPQDQFEEKLSPLAHFQIVRSSWCRVEIEIFPTENSVGIPTVARIETLDLKTTFVREEKVPRRETTKWTVCRGERFEISSWWKIYSKFGAVLLLQTMNLRLLSKSTALYPDIYNI